MARIVRHNDESVREGYKRNGGKEVKLFTSALKAFQCNNRIVIAQRKHLDDFYVVELLNDWNVDVPSWKYPRNLESPRVSSPGFGNDSEMMGTLVYMLVGLSDVFHLPQLTVTVMDDNVRPHRANIVDECLQSDDITRMD
ncbi:transposable element Tc3 transposase [Trichonephila clavipes]|nr:transposable element Tc3 transposase [Trichonephila clavipes]